MKKFKITTLVLLVCTCLTSCLSIGLHAIGAYNEKAEPKVYASSEKTIVYIPMRHIGLKSFYDDVRHLTDSLHSEGYIVFLESVRLQDSLSQKEKDLLNLKLRKMIGTSLKGPGYLDTINHRLMGRRFKNRRGLINQPKYSLMGADTLTDRVVDVPYNKVIAEYERRYGEILLNPCDLTLGDDEKYECGKEPRNQVNNIILNYRNRHLAHAITEEKHNRIAVIYGAMHEYGLFKELKELDSTWAFVPVRNDALTK